MLTRNVVVVLSLVVLLVEGDLDSNDVGKPAVSTDKDLTSDEAPTESMNVISADQPDEAQFVGGGPSDGMSSSSEIVDAPAANQVTAPEAAVAAVAAVNSVEDDDEDESATSGEGGKKKFSSRSAGPPVHQSPRLLPISPAHVIQSPALLPAQPIIPQPKALVRSRASKRRSRTNRRQI
ncbi:hypothetical protein JOB18_027453 [Solea senegalensis]|uniref:Uncharacterized protein n=2 Tax=Solea senegalensis TaxID=28829 RepID=A0AAV6R5T4_SOLSE|nr:uncharacterized protein si:ch211-133n4.6 isoform X3 [Solea senegalensis]KAG7500721.1 hypothetical protein JOB18_027453 [Solea senegalensis]